MTPNPQQTPTLKPGDYDLGSPESRAAARALLDSRFTEDSAHRFRVIVKFIASTRPATCLRDGSVEIIELGTLSRLGNASKEILDRLVSNIPVDGKKYTLEDAKEYTLEASEAESQGKG